MLRQGEEAACYIQAAKRLKKSKEVACQILYYIVVKGILW